MKLELLFLSRKKLDVFFLRKPKLGDNRLFYHDITKKPNQKITFIFSSEYSFSIDDNFQNSFRNNV
jgi:hypothetical protein